MADCKITYKCRLCGEEFEDGIVSEELAQAINMALVVNGHTQHVKCARNVYRNTMHYCKDGSFGFADFLGVRKVGE